MKDDAILIQFGAPHPPTDAESAPTRRTEANSRFLLRLEAPQPLQSIIPGMPISVTGFALAAQPLKEIVVTLGKAVAFAKFGLFRPELAAAFRGNHAVANSGFSCVLQAIQEDGVERGTLTVTARTHGDMEKSVELPLMFGSAPEPVAEIANDVSASARTGEEAMRFSVDQAAVDRNGILRVSGWVVAHARVEAVDAYVDDNFIGTAEYGLKRPDVALAWPDYANALNSGFALVTEARDFPERMQVRIKARTAGGIFRETTLSVQRRDLAARRRAKEHHELVCDIVTLTTSGRLRLTGWAVSSAGIERIRVLFEGESVGEAEFGAERPDVGNKFPTIAQSRQSGFSFEAAIAPDKIRSEHVLVLEIEPPGDEAIPFKIAVAPTEEAEPVAEQTAPGVILFVDEPAIVEGVVTHQIKGGLSIVGWTLANDGIKSVTVKLDGILVGNAHYGMRRPDIAGAFPKHPGALLSGFGFSLARRALSEGRHVVSVKSLSNDLKEQEVEFTIDVAGGEEEEGPWSLRRHLGAAERRLAETLIERLDRKAEFVVWLNCAKAEAEPIRATLRSLNQQIYRNWMVVFVGTPLASEAELIAGELAAIAPQLRWLDKDAPASGLPDPVGDNVWIMPVAAGDILAVDALMEFALMENQEPGCDLLYADERRLNPTSQRVEAFFKPQWSPELLWSTNYIGRPWCAKLEVLERARRSARAFLDFGHYDLVLQCAAQARHITHVPQVLCERRPDAVEPGKTEIQALRRAAKCGRRKVAVEPGRISGTYRVFRKAPPKGLVSILIPTCAARELIKTCIESLRRLTTYPNIEIICVDNIFDEASEWKAWLRANSDIVVEILEPFNWSQFNNIAAREASGEFLLFLNDDIEIIQKDWLEPLLDLAAQPEIGVVGPQLLYPDRKVQHAGMFLAGPSTARHAFRYSEENDPGYHGLALTQRNVIALTGACMLVRTEVFRQLGGFDEAHAVINNDIDFCLKAHDAGLRNVFTPFSQLIHHELASRAQIKDDHDISAFTTRWHSLVASGDPFFHRHLSRSSDNFQYEAEPVRVVFAAYPLYRAADIKRILAVKVDHIGDFVTAFPAFRRIKEKFPQCYLYVLASPALQQLAELEPAIDQVIPFEFFHARSGLGKKAIDESELAELATRLGPLDIDIAIDLRKYPETRPLLRQAGAKWTAGFDWRDQFPWLDIALTWEGDTKFTAKRSHIVDDFVNLIDAVAAAGRPAGNVIRRSDSLSAHEFAIKSQLADEGLYNRPVVCIHPASGNETKQWPPEYFARLADGLIKSNDVNIAVVGGPDEQEIVDRMLEQMTDKHRVTSLVGRLKLGQLAQFLDTCALFVGNDSGPKHIAAALGVPTVGIHSGVVDPREWGPLGDTAVAVMRDMTCSPCYSATPQDCHRGLACLTGLSVAEVLSACRRLLGARRDIPSRN